MMSPNKVKQIVCRHCKHIQQTFATKSTTCVCCGKDISIKQCFISYVTGAGI